MWCIGTYKGNYLARPGRRRCWQARVAAVRSRTSRSSTRRPTKRTVAGHHDDDLSGAGAAARRRTGRFSSRADPSPWSMSRDKSWQEVDGRGVCSRQDHRV